MAHLLLSPQLAAEIAAAVEAGVPLEAAAVARGISDTTLDDWLNIGSGRSHQWRSGDPVSPGSLAQCQLLASSVAQARARREERLAMSLVELAETGTRDDTVRLKATLGVLQTHPSYKKRWGQHVEVHSANDHRILIAELPPLTRAQAREQFAQAQQLPQLDEGGGGGKGSGGVA